MSSLCVKVAANNDDCEYRVTPPQFRRDLDYVTFGASAPAYYQFGGGLRFNNITIPNGSVISSAILTFVCRSTSSGNNCNARVCGEKVSNPSEFADDAGAFSTRYTNHTIAVVDWNTIGAWTIGQSYNSPDIKTVIQEIIGQVGWASCNSLVLFVQDYDNRSTHSTGNYRQFYSYEFEGLNKSAELNIVYEAPESGGGQGGPGLLVAQGHI